MLALIIFIPTLLSLLLICTLIASRQRRQLASTDTVVMVRPTYFAYNPQTAASNNFEHPGGNPNTVTQKAIYEFEAMVAKLEAERIRVIVLNSPENAPDAVFPNNWFSTFAKPKLSLALYPMHTPNRAIERQVKPLTDALEAEGIQIQRALDFTRFEHQQKALEGTGSLIIDHPNRVVYAASSPRTSSDVLSVFCQQLHYDAVIFYARDPQAQAIYHTNVMLSIGTEFAVVCQQAIPANQWPTLKRRLIATGKDILSVNYEQMYAMCCNILELKGQDGKPRIIMSRTAWHAFEPSQRQWLNQYGKLVAVDIPTIERVGGGSARCMLAEIFY